MLIRYRGNKNKNYQQKWKQPAVGSVMLRADSCTCELSHLEALHAPDHTERVMHKIYDEH